MDINLIENREVREYHKNGNLMYETTFGIVPPSFKNLFENTILSPSGEILIRIGMTRRFWDNGQLNWQLKYENNGALSKDRFPSFWKDGSIIQYE